MNREEIYLADNPDRDDIDEIVEWLRVENDIYGEGFYNNRAIIEEAFLKGEVIVLKVSNSNVGLVVWTRDVIYVDIDIFVIKPDYRCKGLGEVFYRAIRNYFAEMDRYALKLFCAPASSEKFWRKMGLIKFPDCGYSYHKLTYYDILVETASTSYINGADKFELWDTDHNDPEINNPKWIWYVNIVDGELDYPIIHPCNCNWRIRWSRDGQKLRENKVKYFTNCPMEYYYSPFILLDELDE